MVNKFKLGIMLSQDDTDYINIDSELIGKINKFYFNTFTHSNYNEVLGTLNNIINNAKVLVNLLKISQDKEVFKYEN